jgi:diguanylate cyclase (GGDEF)-like protein/PAS domain S-box-containing protein
VARYAAAVLGPAWRGAVEHGEDGDPGRTVTHEPHDEVMPGSGPSRDLGELFRLVVEASRDMIIVGRPDDAEWISPAVTELLGYSPEEFLGINISDLVHPDDLGPLQRARRDIAGGASLGGRIRVRHRDGAFRWLEARVRPLADPDGGFSGRSVSSWRAVDREVEALQRLRESEQRHRLLVDHITDGVVLERDGVVVWASPNLLEMLGWDPEHLVGLRILDIARDEIRPVLEEALEATAREESQTLRLQLPAVDGRHHWVEILTRPFFDADGTRDGTACSVRVIDDEIVAEQELERRARHDQLTGLLNRNEVLDRLDALGSDSRRAGTGAAVLFCDLDGFKAVNDTHGHAVGDLVLRTVADRVRGAVREDDLVARIGGDEMLVVLQHLHGVEEALAVADQIRRAVGQAIEGPHGRVSVTMSIGVAMVVPGDSSDAVIARADAAMYQVKEAGRDGVQRLPLDF